MELDARQQFILHAIVVDYVRTAEPIGSEALRLRYDLGVKSATIRNEMAAMAEMGYLRQPHTSAGRIPSDRGYRFYVDRLMTPEPLTEQERDAAGQIGALTDDEIEKILQHACRILSGLTNYTSLATPPKTNELRIKRVQVGSIGPGRLLVVMMLDSGEVKHRLVECGELSEQQLTVLANFVDAKLSSLRVDMLSEAWLGEIPPELSGCDDLVARIVEAVRSAVSQRESDLLLEGASYLIRQPEFKDVQRLRQILDALESRQGILGVLKSVLSGHDVTVVIGAENPYVQDCSFIAARYGVGDRLSGTIGVVGPTRMAYQHAIPAVGQVAISLSALLTRLSRG